MKYLNILSAEDFQITVEAFSYPAPFKACLGRKPLADGIIATGQQRQSFGFCYRTLVGNDSEASDYSYKIHIVYGCFASPSEEANNTVTETAEPKTLSWTVTTTPERIEGFKPTSMIVLDGARYKKAGLMNILRSIEDILYGTDETPPHLPSISEMLDLYMYESYLYDSDGEPMLDSSDQKMRSFVPN